MMSGNGAQLWFALPPTPLEGERRERLQAGLKTFEAAVRERIQSEELGVIHRRIIAARLAACRGSHFGGGLFTMRQPASGESP
jgi:hypothetical protein